MTYLVHHGIQGMKWGVRNGPPYPLTSGSKSASEKREEQKPSHKKNLGEQLANRILSNSGNRRVGDMTEIAVYAAVNILPLIAYVGIVIHQDKKEKREEENEAKERYENRNPKHIRELPRLERPMPPEESMKVINKGFPEEGHVMNCTFCTTAMVMREKGYDVVAQTTDHPWFSRRFWERAFNVQQTDLKKARSSSDVVKALETEGPGAYGNVSVSWKMGGGHSIFWKNDNQGKLHIYDGQSGEEYETTSYSKLMRAIEPSDTSYCRLDNVEPSEFVLAFVTSRNEKE